MKMWQGSLGAGYAYNWVPHKNWLISAMILPVITFYNRGKVFYYERDHPENEVSEEVHFVNSELTDNKIVPNFDTRLSVTYNRARYYLNAYGTYNIVSDIRITTGEVCKSATGMLISPGD